MQEKLIEILSSAKGWMTAAQIADQGGWRSAANVGVALQQMEKANGSTVRRKSPTVKQGNGMPATEWRHADKHFDGDHIPDATKLIKAEPVVKPNLTTEVSKSTVRDRRTVEPTVHTQPAHDQRALDIAVRNHNLLMSISTALGLDGDAAFAAMPEQVSSMREELAENKRLFHAAISDLGSINNVLDLDSDDGGAEPIISAIDDLKSNLETADTAVVRWLALAKEFNCDSIPGLRTLISAAIGAERQWEVAMMAAIGEDGVGSVVEAIAGLKQRIADLEMVDAEFKPRPDPVFVQYVVKTPSKPPRFTKKQTNAHAVAMSAARQHGFAEVFALVPVGKAVRGAEWVAK